MYDIIVFGGGPAGYVAAISAVKAGCKSVALIERDSSQGGGLGGTCLHRGCIPTKTYLDNAETINRVKESSRRGIVASPARIDMPAAVKFKDRVVKRLSMGVGSLLKAWGVELICGQGTVKSLQDIIITAADGSQKSVACKKLILASGSRPARVPIPGIELPTVLNSDELLNINFVPDRLVIVGGGVIGVEMARIFQAYGSKVTIVEMLDRLVPNLDSEVAQAVLKSLKSAKIDVRLSVKVEGFENTNPDSPTEVIVSDDEKTERIPADIVLVAVGRTPNTESFAELHLEMNRRFVQVNRKTMVTSNPQVYAVGDITGLSMLAHSASVMGHQAGYNAFNAIINPQSTETGDSTEELLKNVPSVVYGEPSAAGVGLTQTQAQQYCLEHNAELKIGKSLFGGNGRAVAAGMGDGFVKVLISSTESQSLILGVHLYGPMASELINECSLIVGAESGLKQIQTAIAAHPTFGEAIAIAVQDALGQSVHQPPKSV